MNIEEYPLYYPTRPATLQEFAVTQVALRLCHFECMNPVDIKNCPNRPSCDVFLGRLAPSIKKSIDKRIISISSEIRKVFDYFMRDETAIFFSTTDTGVYQHTFARCFDSFTYGPDAAISLEATGKNLMSNDNLSLIEKYRIACTFCFEDDVRRMWPSVSNDESINTPDYIKDPMLHYWARQINYDRHEPPTYRYIMRMLKRSCDNWATFKYMLNQNSFEDQLSDLSDMFDTYNLKNVVCLLPKLNRAQADHVLRHFPHKIIMELSSKEKYLEYLLQIWSMVKDNFSIGRFMGVIGVLCSKAFRCKNIEIGLQFRLRGRPVVVNVENNIQPNASALDPLLHDPTTIRCKKLYNDANALYEIWINAPDNLKNQFTTRFAKNLFIKLSNFDRDNRIECYNHDMRFFMQLLTDMSFETRNEIWREHWLVFVIRSRPKFLHHFLRLCLRNDEIQPFVETEMMNYATVEKFMEFLLKRNLLKDVIEYTNLCSSNQLIVRNFHKEILTNRFLCDVGFDKGFELSEFIDGCYENVDEARQFKQMLFFNSHFQSSLHSKIEKGLAIDVKRLTDVFLYSESDLSDIRPVLLRCWLRYASTIDDMAEKFDFDHWKEFLLWCGGNHDFLSKFKESIRVDSIFEAMLLEAVPKLSLWLGSLEIKRSEPVPSSSRKLEEFDNVDEFLTWYFVTGRAIRDYKRSRILNYQEMEGVKNVLCANNECVVNDVLRWFFDDDLDEIGYFKTGVLKR
ncbi:uncharacterized protein LOC135845682 [Planococcus citri]|uniref:uncharacterized protein LOC135845682 n=1 Tax=Planococcus citri TaxID=170843 RepID=UPI0031F918B3